MLKKIGSWIGSIKRYVSNVQDQVSNLENETINTDEDSKKKPIIKDKNNEQ